MTQDNRIDSETVPSHLSLPDADFDMQFGLFWPTNLPNWLKLATILKFPSIFENDVSKCPVERTITAPKLFEYVPLAAPFYKHVFAEKKVG